MYTNTWIFNSTFMEYTNRPLYYTNIFTKTESLVEIQMERNFLNNHFIHWVHLILSVVFNLFIPSWWTMITFCQKLFCLGFYYLQFNDHLISSFLIFCSSFSFYFFLFSFSSLSFIFLIVRFERQLQHVILFK